jgi:tRNA (adenine37-N6)-methyltransferase
MERSDAKAIEVRPIGTVRSSRLEPRDDDWGEIASTIELDSELFAPSSLRGLADLSHIEVVYIFHRVDPDTYELAARRPRGKPDWP